MRFLGRPPIRSLFLVLGSALALPSLDVRIEAPHLLVLPDASTHPQRLRPYHLPLTFSSHPTLGITLIPACFPYVLNVIAGGPRYCIGSPPRIFPLFNRFVGGMFVSSSSNYFVLGIWFTVVGKTILGPPGALKHVWPEISVGLAVSRGLSDLVL